MFANILLPIDLKHPQSWEKSLPMAMRLCDEDGAIHLLGIIHDVGAAWAATFLPEDYETQALQMMEDDLRAFVAANVPDSTKAEVRTGHGHVPEQVLEHAEAISADLIVMASHPPDDLRLVFVGSYADRVVRHSPRSVLVVR